MEKCVWICSSLFIDMELWHLVLKNGVKKFCNESTAEKLHCLKLSFSYLSGSNIRLAYKVEHLQADNLTKDLDRYFKQYLGDMAPAKISAKPGNGLFMPMPSYTIKYGLYQLPSFSAPAIDDLETTLSNCIIDALSDMEVDADSLLTLAFYLHVALINEYLQFFSYQDPADILNDLSVPINTGYSDMQFHKNYLECELLLKEIFYQLQYTSAEANPSWIFSWSEACKAVLEQSDLIGSKKFLKDLRNIVDDQLGLDLKLKDLLNYFIQQTYSSRSGQ